MISSRLTTALVLAGFVAGCSSDPSNTADRAASPAAPAALDTIRRDRPHEISYDRHSLIIDGRPIVVQSAEFHYFRLPSPGLWRDVLEKIKAGGFNTVSVYFDWAYHSPGPGVYDFTGVRDVDRFLRTAEDVGLHVIARPGPYRACCHRASPRRSRCSSRTWAITTTGRPRRSGSASRAA